VPKVVDWDARRDEILTATWRVIARAGIAGATIREIAREARCSPGILSHYFNDKADILGAALLMSHRRVAKRMDERVAGLEGLAALRAVMVEALPLDDERDLEAQIEVSFWGRALSNPQLGQLQHSEFERLWSRITRHLLEARRLGELPEGLDLEAAAHELVVLIDGLSVERVLYPTRVPPERQLALLDRLLERLRTPCESVTTAASERGERGGSSPGGAARRRGGDGARARS
jgi:AcrR family transcriptional regulator